MQKYSSLYTKFYIMYSLKLTGNGIKVLCSAVKKKEEENQEMRRVPISLLKFFIIKVRLFLAGKPLNYLLKKPLVNNGFGGKSEGALF